MLNQCDSVNTLDYDSCTIEYKPRYRLASKVLSTTMDNAIRLRDNPAMSETENLCSIFGKWFDCLNARHLKSPKLHTQDPRYEWLEHEFLEYLSEWETEIEALPGKKSYFCLSTAAPKTARKEHPSECFRRLVNTTLYTDQTK